MFIFDSQSDFFRNPQGAVSTNRQIELKIYVKRTLTQKPVIRIEKRYDYENHLYKEITTEWIGTEKAYDLYKGTFTIKDPEHPGLRKGEIYFRRRNGVPAL